jgi:hypothetical protein
MKKKITVLTFSALLTAGLAMNGCAAKRIDTSEVPQQAPANETAAAPAPAPSVVPVQYVVEKHDSLWAISSRSQVYGDPFEWPLIFKANRDQIQDPDLIYPQQVFKIEKDATTEDQDRAKKLAMETPKYTPHTKPREILPIDYF